MNIQLIVQLLVLVGEARTGEDVTADLESLLKAYGFTFYALVTRKRDQDTNNSTIAARWPDGWMDVYKARKYLLIDPSMRMMGMAQRPFRWSDALDAFQGDPHRQRMDRMMQEARRYGLDDGYVFPLYGRNGFLGSLTLAGKVIDLSPTEISLFDAAAKRVFWRHLELRGEAERLENTARLDTPLTRREMEVIGLLADGMTSNEIAKTLDISAHTVDWYINGLQEKLMAKNRQHVVAMAFRLGLVT